MAQPSNQSELQLFRVLQRANLLQYFETFITQGGDDVQQLCEAGEDEFLEIMALVGMASKPLHVRRLQKALQEWVSNPAAFEGNAAKKYPTHVMSMTGTPSQSLSPSHSLERANSLQDFKMTPPQSSAISTSTPWNNQSGASPSDGSLVDPASPTDPLFPDDCKDGMFSTDSFNLNMHQPGLLDHQIAAIASAAAILAQDLPPLEPKSLPRKQISKEIQAVMLMSPDDPNRMDALRKYAAIYGRFDSKRKNDKPMTLHEISVNEASAQLCSHIPALLTRREELFPLARQVVRDSGYQYSKGHSRYERAAEVLITPKSEPEDPPSTTPPISSTSTSSSPSPRGFEKTLNDLQAELSELTLALSEMNKEQSRIRAALRVLLENNDHEQMRALTAEMDVLNDRQSAMTKRRQTIVNAIAKYRKNSSKSNSVPAAGIIPSSLASKPSPTLINPTAAETTTAKLGSRPRGRPKSSLGSINNNSINMKNNNYSFGYGRDDLPSMVLPTNPLNTLYMAALQNSSKDSLFEEGLRIATQYGMADFAKELIGMKSQDPKSDTASTTRSGAGGDSVATSSGNRPGSSSSSEGSGSGVGIQSGSGGSGSGSGKQGPNSSASYQPLFASALASTSAGTSGFPGVVALSTYSNSMAQSSGEDNSHYSLLRKELLTHPELAAQYGSKPNVTLNSDLEVKNSPPEPITNHTTATTTTTSSSNNNYGIASPRESPIPMTTAELATGSTTTTTTITTKTGQVIEVETRRSSRKRNGEPDYYLINGGEKRFRTNSGSRRSSSTSSERSTRLSTSGQGVSPSKTKSSENDDTLADGVKDHTDEMASHREGGKSSQKKGGSDTSHAINEQCQDGTSGREEDMMSEESCELPEDSASPSLKKRLRT